MKTKLSQSDIKNIDYITNDLVKNNPQTAAILSKLITPEDQVSAGSNDPLRMQIPEIKQLSEKIYEKTKINDDIMELFPDAYIAAEIIVGSITCPNDLMTTNLIYKAPDEFPMPDTIKEGICGIIANHIDRYYKLKDKLPNMLIEAIFTKGAHITAFIPEASLDDIINSNVIDSTADYYKNLQIKDGKESIDLEKGLENLKRRDSLGYLSPSSVTANDKYLVVGNLAIGLESAPTEVNLSDRSNFKVFQYDINFGTEHNNITTTIKLPYITDNFTRILDIQKAIKETKNNTYNNVKHTLNLDNGLESLIDTAFTVNEHTGKNYESNEYFKGVNPKGTSAVSDAANNKDDTKAMEEYIDIFMKRSKRKSTDDDVVEYVDITRNASRESIGRPLVIELPVESVIPVHSPLNKEEHLGYFVIVDEQGKILDLVNEENKINGDMNTVSVLTTDSSTMINKGLRQTQALTSDNKVLSNNEEIFTRIVYNMLQDKLKNGAFGELADINNKDNLIYKLMFRRALQNKGTQIIFLPAELVSYYAYEYRDNGTGKSLFEKTALLYSVRATLLMSTIHGHLRNSTNTTQVDIDLPPEVTNADAVVEQIASTIIKNREHALPLGLVRPADISHVISRLGYKFNVTSPHLPQIKIDANDTSRNVKIPDQEVDDKLMEMQALTYGLTPDMIRGGFDPDFATTVIGRQGLMNKRTKNKIDRTNYLNSEYVRKVLRTDAELRTEIIKYLGRNLSRLTQFLTNSINNMQGGTKNKMTFSKEAFRMYIEKAINAFQDGLLVELPELQLNSSSAIMENLNAAFSNIDTIIDALFSSDVINSELLGETLGEQGEHAINLLKTSLKQKWVSDNNVLPELGNILTEQTLMRDSSTNAMSDFMVNIGVLMAKFNNALEARKELVKTSNETKALKQDNLGTSWGNPEDDSYGGSYDSGGDFGGGSDDAGDDSGGGDDFGSDGGSEGGEDPLGSMDDIEF